MSTLKDIENYRKALIYWKERNGLNGGGGAYDRTKCAYLPASEPHPDAFNLNTDYLRKVAQQIRNQVMQ